MATIIGVCGSGFLKDYDTEISLIAEQVGTEIARHNGILICGGKGGVMEAACKGAKQKGGLTIGILPYQKEEKNPYVDIPIITGIGEKRNAIIVQSSDCIIALAGRWGTLNEITLAGIYQTPIVFLKDTKGFVDSFIQSDFLINYPTDYAIASSASEAVTQAIQLAEQSHPKH